MLSGKQRAYLRSLSNPLKSTLIVGKDGIGRGTFQELEDQLKAHELVKLTFLDTAGLDIGQEVDGILEQLGAEFVSQMGAKLVIYRPADPPKIQLPR